MALLLLGDTRAVLLSRETTRGDATENKNINKQKIWNGNKQTVERCDFWIFDWKHQPRLLERTLIYKQ